MSKVFTRDTPSYVSGHLKQVWKESIRNVMRNRADTRDQEVRNGPTDRQTDSLNPIYHTPHTTQQQLRFWMEYLRDP